MTEKSVMALELENDLLQKVTLFLSYLAFPTRHKVHFTVSTDILHKFRSSCETRYSNLFKNKFIYILRVFNNASSEWCRQT